MQITTKNNKDSIKLEIFGANPKECSHLKEIYEKLSENSADCHKDEGNFHYGITINVLKIDESH